MEQSNFMQVIEQTHEEKVAMYMKYSKKELIAMLLENQRLLSLYVPIKLETINQNDKTVNCKHDWQMTSSAGYSTSVNVGYHCLKCGKYKEEMG